VTGLGGGPSGAIHLDPVQVQGYPVPTQAMVDNVMPPYAGGQVATGGQLGLLGNRSVMDTPFNQTNYTAKKAQDQQARTIRDVLVDDPSVRSWGADGGVGGDNTWIRGFNISTRNTAYGGLYGMLPDISIMPELAERIELLRGPTAMLNGMPPNNSNIGGSINIVPKRAPDYDLTQATANYVSAGQVGGHVDFARRLGTDKQFGIRFNGVFRGGETAVENNSDQRGLAVLGLDFRGERVRLAADLGYQYQSINWVIPYFGINPGVQLPWAPDARKNVGQPWSNLERNDLFGVVRGEVDLTERLTAYAAFGAHDTRVVGVQASQVIASNFNGTATSAFFANNQYTTTLTAEVGVRGLVETGPISHEFAVTATTLQAMAGSVQNFGTPFATNFYNPVIVARPNIVTPAANKTSTQGLSSLGFADTLSAAEKRIQLTAGVRLQQVQAANYDPVTGAETASYNQNAVSPSVSLVFKPWDNVSIYGNWIQGLQQGTIVQAPFVNAGEIFPPFKSTQYEAGVKLDWGKFTTTASVFQISQPSILTNTANNTQFLGGEQRNQGLELNFFGEPIEGVRVLGGAMFLSGVLAKTQGGTTDGWVAPFAPVFNLNLAGEWDLPFVRGLTLNGRLIYTSSQYIDTTFPRRSLPDWTRFDIGARYAFENPGAKGKLLVARFNVENVLDADYWAGGNSATFLNLGAPRTLRVSLTADF
jgi:iron complex outermembrane receptor protein